MTGRAHTIIGDERGTILPLIAGYLVLGLLVIFVAVNVMSLHIAQRRLDALADAAALAGADGFRIEVRDGEPIARLYDTSVFEQAQAVLVASDDDVILGRASTPDGTSAEVTLRTEWQPVLIADVIPASLTLESTARSRTAFE